MTLTRKLLDSLETTGWRAPIKWWVPPLTEHPSTAVLRSGTHIAPYLDLDGRPVLLHVARGGVLVDVTTSRNDPAPESMLPRGVHLAPWRDGNGMPVLLAIDAQHQCVAWTANDGGMLSAIADLLLVLEAHAVGSMLEGEDADDDDPSEAWKRGR